MRSDVLWIRRCVTLLVGMGLLAGTFRFSYDDPWFYAVSALLGVCWTIGWWSDRVHLPPRAPGSRIGSNAVAVALGVGFGAALAGCCAAGAVILRDAPVVGDSIAALLGPVDGAVFVPVLVTAVVVGASEELMFRGAVFAWFGRYPIIGSTLVYTAVTAATGTVSLLAAAIALGIVTGWLRLRTRGLIAPVSCHITWSVLSLAVLPGIIA